MSAPAPTSFTRAASASIDVSTRDLTLDLARVVCVLLVVAIHLLMVGVGYDGAGGLVVSVPLEGQTWFNASTWVGQIMPLFFVVGGFASLTAWRRAVRRGGTAVEYVRNRMLRLARPTLPLYVFYVIVIGAATLFGADRELLRAVITGTGSVLWFIAAYALCQALVPWAAHLHQRAPRATLLVLLAGVIAVDAARFGFGIRQLGYLNMLFVWVLVQQLGFWYADGWFARRRWWQLALLVAAAYLALGAVVAWGPYWPSMLANLNPPTLPLVLLGVAQVCLLRLLHDPLAALMHTHVARAAVFLVGTRLMTIYLWHLPVIIALTGIGLLMPWTSPSPETAAWWWTRPVLFLLTLAGVYGLSFLVGRWEAVGELAPTPPAWVVAIGVVLVYVPTQLIVEFYLEPWLAMLGAVCFAAAVLLLGRRPSRRSPSGRAVTAPAPSAGA